uniref:Uncharacterized protein n=1 Tax=Eutreptiella gymnastica TaxID=73025 RepID=A0A7S4FFB5_9EUGL|mmetsp:Transcript_29985/g.50791  ORF Transcript_29985/g.50791 Transcript_29985/m.50791 type:complete len:105 (+) Transcript_29985:459-773(+)
MDSLKPQGTLLPLVYGYLDKGVAYALPCAQFTYNGQPRTCATYHRKVNTHNKSTAVSFGHPAAQFQRPTQHKQRNFSMLKIAPKFMVQKLVETTPTDCSDMGVV